MQNSWLPFRGFCPYATRWPSGAKMKLPHRDLACLGLQCLVANHDATFCFQDLGTI